MRLLAVCPRIHKESDRIIAATAWRICFLFLGMVYRKVVIDLSNKTVSINSRYLWFIHRQRTIPFSQIEAVTYGYDDLSPKSFFTFAHDSFDKFRVGLRLDHRSEIHLFNFTGEGTFNNHGPFPDWMYWEEFAFDRSGSQENESRIFVEILSKMIGVTVVPPSNY